MNLNKKVKKVKKEEGFTLIEILIAIALLAFGLLAMASMQVMAIQTNGKSNRITEGTRDLNSGRSASRHSPRAVTVILPLKPEHFWPSKLKSSLRQKLTHTVRLAVWKT